ncbi:tyrosine-type recombinase/integrase [Gracilimonas sp.]|uniref:tyrosine-type recombinase/integrase n=1 Tax=Gracilimonas sp. TaxID=1974203 RepID=UPI003BA9BBB0
MASLKKRNGTYYIRFFTKIDDKRKQKALSLGTSIKREAEKLLIDYEDKFERGEIDPFNGWTPKMEAENKRKKLPGKHISMKKASDQFISSRSQANQTTKDNYRRILNMFMDQVGTTMPITQIIEQDIRSFCFKSDLAPASQANYLRHLKVFFTWLRKTEILKEDITENIKSPKIPQKITQKTVNRKQLDKIFDAFDVYNQKMQKKGFITKPEQQRLWFKPMINTIYYCGLRAKEAVNLTWEDIELSENSKKTENFGVLKISNSETNTTKSGKERIIPIRKPLYKWLKKWKVDQGNPSDGFVFPSATGFNRWQQMDSLALSKSFKKFVKLTGDVPNTVTLHGLRHSCATDLLAKGVSPAIVQKIMGHASINTTMIYEHLDASNINEAIKGID